jgi:hypothetical protein
MTVPRPPHDELLQASAESSSRHCSPLFVDLPWDAFLNYSGLQLESEETENKAGDAKRETNAETICGPRRPTVLFAHFEALH